MIVMPETHWELVLRILVGCVLGGMIGYERDLHGRPAGLRTHVMVALASATFMTVSSHFVYFQHYTHEQVVDVDASRIAASVVSGIGFLAGGAIFRTGLTVKGLTTAASLWLVAAIGLSAGAGMWIESTSSTGIGLVVLTFLRRFEDKNDHMVGRKLYLLLNSEAEPVSHVLNHLKGLGALVSQTEYESLLDEGSTSVHFDLLLPASLGSDKLLETLEAMPGVRRVRLESVAV